MAVGDQLWSFLNSPVGLLLIGFVFTTVVGKFLATWYQSASKKQEIRFVQLHQDRLRAMKDLHDRTVDLKKALFRLLYKGRPIEPDTQPLSTREIWGMLHEFHDVTEKNKIYFNKEICTLIDSLLKTFESTLRSMERANPDAQEQPPNFDEEAYKGVHQYSDELLSKLRNEFREIMGVD